MKTQAFSPALALLIVLCLATCGTAEGDCVDDVINAQMKERHIPGVALAVIEAGKIVREQGLWLQ